MAVDENASLCGLCPTPASICAKKRISECVFWAQNARLQGNICFASHAWQCFRQAALKSFLRAQRGSVTCQASARHHCALSHAGHCFRSFAKSRQTMCLALGQTSIVMLAKQAQQSFRDALIRTPFYPELGRNQHTKIHECAPRRHRVGGARVCHNRKTCFKISILQSLDGLSRAGYSCHSGPL